jgi:predicted DNA-binding protein
MGELTERLVKTAVTLTAEQLDRLRRRGRQEERSVSYYLRTAIEKVYPAKADDDTEGEAA